MIEHCISTLKLHKEQEATEKSFRTYVTDSLMAIAENTTHYIVGAEMVDVGKSMKSRWFEVIEDSQKPKVEEPEDTRSAEEIATDMWKRIRGN